MNAEQPLIVSKRDKVKGLYVFCKKCKQTIDSKVCGKTGKSLRSCKNTDQHCFRAVISVPNTGGRKRKTRVLNTKDVKEAVRQKYEFERELLETDYQLTENHIERGQVKPLFLIECMSMYVGYLNNVGVEEHKRKVRTRAYLKEVEHIFKRFLLCLKEMRIDHTIYRVEQLNDRIVGHYHNHLLNKLNYKNKTYNKHIAQMRQFINWLIDKRGYQINNPFRDVVRRPVANNKITINREEFECLLKQIKPQCGYIVLPSGERKNLYRNWMGFAFRLALETGLRREEFLNIKYSDIKEDDKGNLKYIQVENYKVNRLLNRENEAKQYKSVPITNGLKQLLSELNYNKRKGQKVFLIAPDEISSRKTLMLVVSKAFSHYWKQTGIKKDIQLKHLRKTYLTALVNHFGEKATVISNHSGINVLKKHYIDQRQLLDANNNFKVL